MPTCSLRFLRAAMDLQGSADRGIRRASRIPAATDLMFHRWGWARDTPSVRPLSPPLQLPVNFFLTGPGDFAPKASHGEVSTHPCIIFERTTSRDLFHKKTVPAHFLSPVTAKVVIWSETTPLPRRGKRPAELKDKMIDAPCITLFRVVSLSRIR